MIKSKDEIERMRVGGKFLGQILKHLTTYVKPGVSTEFLNIQAEVMIADIKAKPAFKGYQAHGMPPFSSSLCTSINEEIVHGEALPARIIKEGDIIGLDLGLIHEGMYLDAALTVPVGKVSKEASRLIKITQEALAVGLKTVKAGVYIGDYGCVVEQYADKHDLGVVYDLVGHGVGRDVHEPPAAPNYGEKGWGEKLRTGMTIAFEPMFTLGSSEVKFGNRSWQTVTADGSLSAHFEHTVLVTESGCDILTQA